MWFLSFLFLQKSHMDHPKNIICQQTSSPVYPSVAMITLLTKGFSFFSQSAVSASCHLHPPQASAIPYVVIDPAFTLTY